MEMTYDDMLREMEAYYAAAELVVAETRCLTHHEEMLERLCGKDACCDDLLAILRKTFTAEEAETWLLCPAFSKTEAPLTAEELAEKVRPELRERLTAITNKLLDRKVLLHVKKPPVQGYFARCDAHCVGMLRNLKGPQNAEKSSSVKVLTENCIGCKICTKACPVDAIQVMGRNVFIDDGMCIGCGVCVRKCPKKALKL